MQALTKDQVSALSPSTLRQLAIDQSQDLVRYDKYVKSLENRLTKLAEEELRLKQRVLIDAEQLNSFKDRLFGNKSERVAEIDDSPLFGKSCDDGCTPEQRKNERKKRTSTGRRPQPNLPVEEVEHRFPAEYVQAEGLREWLGQYETSELINVVPSRFVLEIHKRQKYFKQNPETKEREIVVAPGPMKLKDKSRYSVEFAVEVGLGKYEWHLPLDRQVRLMGDLGLETDSQTLFSQVDTIAWYFESKVFGRILDDIRGSRVLMADETSWKNLQKKSQRNKSKFYLWGVQNSRAVGFNVYEGRSQKIAKEFLKGLRGTLITDGYCAYKALASEDLRLANDWIHVRRKFFEAEKNFSAESKFFIDRIKELSKIEESILLKPPDERLKVRQEESREIVEKIRQRLCELSNVLPESSLGKAVNYTLKLWDGLTVFLEDGEVPFHTNDIERSIRGPALGRKNHYGSKNLETAHVAAVWYTIIETCKLNQVNPRQYILSALKSILQNKPVLLPWEWSAKEKTSEKAA